MRGLMPLALVVAAVTPLLGTAAARSPDPKVPVGRDPGGVAVAIIGTGLDYRGPEFHPRLARDGEGVPIAWDFADNDPRPFSVDNGDAPLASVLLAEGQATRLVLARVPAGRQDLVAAAVRFVARTPARIVLVAADPGGRLRPADLAEAARHLPGLLLVVPARRVSREKGDASPAQADRAGLLVVAGAGDSVTADVVVPVPADDAGPVPRPDAVDPHPDDIAAASVASLAARLIAIDPGLNGAGLRSRILSFATGTRPGPPAILGIRRIHWLE